DWKDGKWEWIAGHAEQERAGKHWRDHRWEQRNGHYELVEGGWEDGGAPAATGTIAGKLPTTAPPPPREEHGEGTRPGELGAKGRWDWRDGKGERMAGHWEKGRPGKRRRGGRGG